MIGSISSLESGEVSENDLMEELGALHYSAFQEGTIKIKSLLGEGNVPQMAGIHAPSMLGLRKIGKWVLSQVQNILCENGKANGTLDEIIGAVIDALVSIIPAGKLILLVIRKVAKYIFDLGGTAFCELTY